MDMMSISAGSPQEDEFGLLLLGAPSPYEHLLFPERLAGMEEAADLDALTQEQRQRWLRHFTTLLSFCCMRGGRPVLKSPTHSFRIRYLSQLFPGAQFIHIVRHPQAVFHSTKHLWSTLWGLYALGPVLESERVSRLVADGMIAMDRRCRQDMDRLAPGMGLTIRYEDLVRDPDRILQGIGQSLALPQILARPDHLPKESARVSDYRASKWPVSGQVREMCRGLYDRYGYKDGIGGSA